MKLLPLMISLFCALSCSGSEDKVHLFQNPLILGASVSAGYGTSDGGPGAVISRLINPEAKIDNRAKSGQTSIESTRNLDLSKGYPSIILALDLFFWDAARDRYGEEFEHNTSKLLNSIFKKDIPVIIGKVPEGVQFPDGIREAGKRRSAKLINTFLEKLCTIDKNCLLYDPAICFKEMNSSKYFSDSLHTTEEGNLFCAKIFVKDRPYASLQ